MQNGKNVWDFLVNKAHNFLDKTVYLEWEVIS